METPTRPRKLYVVTHRELPIGLQAAQAGHAAIEYQYEHPELAALWRQDNYLIILSALDQQWMLDYEYRCRLAEVPTSVFHEPDLDGAATAFAASPDTAVPGLEALFGGLTLLGRKPRRRKRRLRGTEWSPQAALGCAS